MIGTVVNAAAILAGGGIGLLLRSRLPKRIVTIVFQAIGLFTLFLGVTMAMKTSQFLVLIFSLVIGSIAGEAIDLEKYMQQWSNSLKKRLKSKNSRFSEGLVTAFLLYCMGSMTILGAFEEGMGDYPNLLLAKSVLDGFSSIALASALGVGVLFSVVPLLIYQGGLTLLAAYFGNFFPETIIDELTATGGILLIGLGINILEIKQLRVLNMLPALIVVVVLAYAALHF